MSLCDIYSWVENAFEVNRCGFFELIRTHINWSEIIPVELECVYYAGVGRRRGYSLESMISMLVLKTVFGYRDDTQLLDTLRYSKEMREFCGLRRVPDAAQLSRFRIRFADYLQFMLDELVELTEPICREMNPELADCLAFDTTGVESYVRENNPKFFNSKLRQAKAMCKNNQNANPYQTVYGLLPEVADTNHDVKQQYINGHFCYAQRFAIVTNGLGVVRDIRQLGRNFKAQHPEMKIGKRTDNPNIDKEISDSAALKPVLSDFFAAHPGHSRKTFLGDSAFDSYDNYSLLLNDFDFDKALIPLNSRISSSAHDGFDQNGVPLCPNTGKQLKCLGLSGGKNRSNRIKFVCPKSLAEHGTRVCKCETPCTHSEYGRTVYVYPDKELRNFPGIMRGTQQWAQLYKNRTAIERTIGYLKINFSVADRKTSHPATTLADFLIAGITQLLGVLIAHKIHNLNLARSIRKILRAS
jgi:hypothetical protein